MFARLIAIVTAVAALGAAQNDRFDDVMRRVHEYVAVYEDHELSSVIGQEEYRQRRLNAEGVVQVERVLRSEYLIFQLPPEEDWFALRIAQEVDGITVLNEPGRLAAIFSGPPETITERAMAAAEGNARFNLGEVYRTINIPTFALRFLRPATRSRFRYRRVGEESVDGMTTWVISYQETGRPTFSATQQGDDVPARGRFWVEPQSGAVVRSEMIVGGSRSVRERATVTVTYRNDPELGFRVPAEMRERYETPGRRNVDVIEAVATYSGFRPFDPRALAGRGGGGR